MRERPREEIKHSAYMGSSGTCPVLHNLEFLEGDAVRDRLKLEDDVDVLYFEVKILKLALRFLRTFQLYTRQWNNVVVTYSLPDK